MILGWFGFDDVPTIVGYLISSPYSYKNSSISNNSVYHNYSFLFTHSLI